MYGSLTGKTVLVTGAGKNIGESIAYAFAAEGCNLILHALHASSVARTMKNVRSRFSNAAVSGFACDMRDRDAFSKGFDGVVAEMGNPDILVNNAGGSAGLINKISSFVDAELSTHDFVIDLNLKGTILATKLVLPTMIKRGWGRVINIASIAGEVGLVNRVDYSAAKAGVIGLTRALAMEVGRFGVTVNCVSPGGIMRGQDDRFIGTYVCGGGRSKPCEIANMVTFLASDQGRFITGVDYAVDGGLTLGTSNCRPSNPDSRVGKAGIGQKVKNILKKI